jgi:hypothetical protein
LWLFTYLFLPPPIFDDDGGEPTVQLNWSSPVLPASSVALTVTSWVPLVSLSYTTGLVQNVNACPSRLHSVSSIPTASVASNVILMYGTAVLLLQPPPSVISLSLLPTALVITTSGSIASCTVIVKYYSDGLPAASSGCML